MTASGEPRVGRDRNLDHAESFELDQRGKESVRTVEKLHLRDAFALKCAVGATGIADGFAGEFVAHRICDSR